MPDPIEPDNPSEDESPPETAVPRPADVGQPDAGTVAIIEIELDADPFANLVPVTSIRTVDDLAKKGFPPRVLKALLHISRVEPETYEQYIDRVVQDNLAIRVKLHDLADKMDLLHVDQLDPADLKRYNKQLTAYHRMKRIVEEAKANMHLQTAAAKVR